MRDHDCNKITAKPSGLGTLTCGPRAFFLGKNIKTRYIIDPTLSIWILNYTLAETGSLYLIFG